MCRHQYLLYTCTHTSPRPIYTGCPPDRCLGPYIDRTPKRMSHACAACAHRRQQDAHSRATAFDDGSNAARHESVRRWEAGRATSDGGGWGGGAVSGSQRSRSRSASVQLQTTRNGRHRSRTRNRSVSPPALRHGSQARSGSTHSQDELMCYSSEDTVYTIRYNRGSGAWSSVASPSRRHHRHRRHRR